MGFFRNIKKDGALYIMALPALIALLAFSYLPMFGVILAFKRINYASGILKSPWVGFDNFKFLFKSNAAFTITRNTIVYNLVFIVLGLVFATFIAIILNEIKNRIASKIYQTVFIMPYFLSWVVVAFVAKAFLDHDLGYINHLLTSMGLEKAQFYFETKYWPFILVFAQLWKTLGYNSIIYLAAITGISTEYYESATLDGATKWQQAIYITIPSIKPMIIILTIMAVGKIFNSDFGLFYQVPLGHGQLYPVTQVIDTYVYNGLVQGGGNIGMSAAAGLYQSVVGFILVVVTNKITKKVDEGYALF